MIAKSMIMSLSYQTPIGPIDEKAKILYDMEGFKGFTVFSDHIYNVLKNAVMDGFKKVKDDARFIALIERIKAVSTVESINNLLFLMDKERDRSDVYVKGKKWVCALIVKDVGAYIIFDDARDIDEKFDRMQQEGNTLVYQVACVEFGGGFIKPPEIIKKRLFELNDNNRKAQVVSRDNSGEIIYTEI